LFRVEFRHLALTSEKQKSLNYFSQITFALIYGLRSNQSA
jgi:hypothetical protein